MARSRRGGRPAPEACGCLPDAIPEDVQRVLDEEGGLGGLLALLPEASALDAEAAVHSALSDPLRLRILRLLGRSPLCVCVIRATFDIPDSKLSYHLGILKSAHLARSKKRGNWIIYELTDEGRRWLDACTA